MDQCHGAPRKLWAAPPCCSCRISPWPEAGLHFGLFCFESFVVRNEKRQVRRRGNSPWHHGCRRWPWPVVIRRLWIDAPQIKMDKAWFMKITRPLRRVAHVPRSSRAESAFQASPPSEFHSRERHLSHWSCEFLDESFASPQSGASFTCWFWCLTVSSLIESTPIADSSIR